MTNQRLIMTKLARYFHNTLIIIFLFLALPVLSFAMRPVTSTSTSDKNDYTIITSSSPSSVSAHLDSDSDDSISSHTSSTGSSGSNWSDDELSGESFGFYLNSKNIFEEYQSHTQTADGIAWRKILRDTYLDECVKPKAMQQFCKNDSDIHKLAQKATTMLMMAGFLTKIHEYAIQAFPDNLFEGESTNTIGIYRHKFCKTYIDAIRDCQEVPAPIRELRLEQSYKDKIPVTHSTAGSIRPDVYWPSLGVVFDFKNFDAGISETEIGKWREHLPLFVKFFEISE